MRSSKIKVVFIASSARSGTTLLDLLLGQTSGFFSLGEMFYIWERGFIENRLCGCGKPFRDCEFWQKVIEEAFGGFEKVDARSVLELQRSVVRIRLTPQLAYPRLRTREFSLRLEQYADILRVLYRAIAKVSGADVLIDSSKFAPYGFVLSQLPELEIYPIHLVRDSRAVVYSLQRKKRMSDVYWKEEFIPVASTLKAIQLWLIHNGLAQIFIRRHSYGLTVPYELFAARPGPVVTEIVRRICDVDSVSLPFFLNDFEVELGVNHTVAGNPIRLNSGRIKIRPDVEWLEKIPIFKKALIGALTWPQIWKSFE